MPTSKNYCLIVLIYSIFFTPFISLLEARSFTIAEKVTLAEHMLPKGKTQQFLDSIFQMYKDPDIAFRMAGCTFLKSVGRLVVTHPSIPEFVLKATSPHRQQSTDTIANLVSSNRNLKRILMNKRIRECVAEFKLSHIYVPTKYVYHIPGTPDDFNDAHYIIVAEKLDLLCEECNRHQFAFHMTPAEERSVITVIEEVGYADAALHNIYYLKSGLIAFIDTEHIYAIDVLETFGLGKLVHAYAARQGRKRFEEECKKLRRYSRAINGADDSLRATCHALPMCNAQLCSCTQNSQ